MTFFNFSLYSQQNNIRFKHITVGDGLSQSNVQCIFQDSKGFIWIGTQDGLNKFDGYDFIIYRNNLLDSNSISGNRIVKILEDSTGIIWVATYFNGINAYNRATDKFTQYKHDSIDSESLVSDLTLGIDIDSKNQITVSCISGISIYNKEKDNFTNYHAIDFFGKKGFDGVFYSAVESNDHEKILTNYRDSLYLFNASTNDFSRIAYQTNKPNQVENTNFGKNIFIDSKNIYWVYAAGHGIYKLNRSFELIEYYGTSNGKLSNNDVKDIVEVGKGVYWAITDGGGVNIIDENNNEIKILKYDPVDKNSIAGDKIYDVLIDNTGVIWLGHFNKGISYYNPSTEKFKSFYHNPEDPTSISDYPILSIFEDSKGRIWVGTDGGGLNLFDKKSGTFQHYTKEHNGLSTNVITAIHENSEGNLLLGTWNGGLMIFNPNTGHVKIYKTNSAGDSKIISNNVWAIEADKNGNIWLGLLGRGLNLYKPETGEFIDYGLGSGNPNTIDHSNVMTLMEDSKNNIWIATEGTGVYKYIIDEDKMVLYNNHPNDSNSLVTNSIVTLFEDSEGNIWMGSQSKGLSIYNPSDNSYTHVSKKDGLPNDAILGIVEDANNTFWISTTNGISHYNREKGTFRNYDKADGLQGNEFKYNASILASDGMIYMGGMKGLSVFHPDSIKDNLIIPPIYFTEFSLFDKPVEIGVADSPLKKHISETDTIILDYDQNIFTISYVALNYTSTEKNQYAYKMIGFDKDYRSVGSIRDATYTNLDPGTYIFHVK
ncbi:MAG: triple tyrosine motif-containing protein, partial [Salinivirgaceae bacterium]|nr:triple tyrosine motif-containing protein [Salinivirgaceae bacterium]